MKIILDNLTHPEVEILVINISNKTVDFKDVIDGICNAPYLTEGDIPTAVELTTAISAVLGESES
jgi:hypothetical protein